MTRAGRLAALAVLATAVLSILAAAPAAATDVTAKQLAVALRGADPAQRIARLKTLGAPRAGEPTLIPDSGARAATILRDLGYKPPPQSAATSSTSSGGSGGLPGPAWLWLALGALVVVVSSVAASRALSRLEPPVREAPSGDGAPDERATRASLERDANAAEARGAFSEAVRLRFRAGLLGLTRASVIDGRPSLRNAEISREIRSPEFDRLAGTFERVAYGGEPASSEDASEAREGWPRVLSGTPR